MKLKDGDTIELKTPVLIDSYWYCDWLGQGSYQSGYMLAGTRGKVIRSHTPCVRLPPSGEHYFANVDVTMQDGSVIRVRPLHSELRRV